MDENEALDYALSELNNSHQGFKTSDEFQLSLFVKLRIVEKDKDNSVQELIEILQMDKYIVKSNPLGTEGYRITFNGKRFLRHGGYTTQAKDLSTRRVLRSLEKVLIVLGTLGAGLYGIFEIWRYFCHC